MCTQTKGPSDVPSQADLPNRLAVALRLTDFIFTQPTSTPRPAGRLTNTTTIQKASAKASGPCVRHVEEPGRTSHGSGEAAVALPLRYSCMTPFRQQTDSYSSTG